VTLAAKSAGGGGGGAARRHVYDLGIGENLHQILVREIFPFFTSFTLIFVKKK
jgi:hypothetical protein